MREPAAEHPATEMLAPEWLEVGFLLADRRLSNIKINAGGKPFPTKDQRGVKRPQGRASDIGAVEKKRAE